VRQHAVPTRHDATAIQFLDVAAELIDVFLQTGRANQSAQLQQVRFPAALDWLRTEDVIRLTRIPGGPNAGRREFFNRWTTRDEFVPDAVVYALLREYDADDPRDYVGQLPEIPNSATSISALLTGVADGLLAALTRHPRSYLMLHLGPLLPQYPEIWNALRPGTRAATNASVGAYEQLVSGLGLVMRPEWSVRRVSLVLQAMLDGFVLRQRLQPDDYSRWQGTSIFADAIIAFMIGAVDWDLTGQASRSVLDNLIRPWSTPSRC
jgi:hypothetical protein